MKTVYDKEKTPFNLLQDTDIEHTDKYIKFPNGTMMFFSNVRFEPNQESVKYYYPVNFTKVDKIYAWHGYANEPYGYAYVGAGDRTWNTFGCRDVTLGISKERSADILVIGRWK